MSHYGTLLPEVIGRLQDMEERRIRDFGGLLKKAAECEDKVAPIIKRCVEGVIRAAESVTPNEVGHWSMNE